MDTFVFWPDEGQEESQLRLFAEQVVPKVRASLAEKGGKGQVTHLPRGVSAVLATISCETMRPNGRADS
jgi:hypothetical protein